MYLSSIVKHTFLFYKTHKYSWILTLKEKKGTTKEAGSGVLPSKMLLVKIIENKKNYAYFRLSKGLLCPTGLEKNYVRAPQGLEIGKNSHSTYF